MPVWLVIIIVLAVIGAIVGLIGSFSNESDLKPHQGCLAGAATGAAGGMGCLAIILEAILPLVIAFLIFSWLFSSR